MRFVPAHVVGTLATSLLLVGCVATPAAPPTPTPVPTFLCTPEAGGAEYVCDQRAYDEMKAKDALYAEAEAVYRRFFEEDNRIQLSGDHRVSAIIEETTGGPFRDALADAYGQLKELGVTASSGSPELVSLRREPDVSQAGSLVALTTCVDASRVLVLEKGRPAGTGIVNRNTYFFVRSDGLLKIWTARGGEVERC